MAKIGVVINPHAKIIRKNKKHLELYEKLGSDLVDIKITKTLYDIDNVLNKFKDDRISYLGIVGGDGSIHNVITRAINIFSPANMPDILILKGGTMNNVARSLKLKGKGPHILKRLVKSIKEERKIELVERDTMKIQDCYCFIFGTAIVTNFLKEVYKYEKGWIANFKVIFKTLCQIFKPGEPEFLKNLNAKILLDNKPLEFDEISVILGGTVESVSNGINIMARAHDEKFRFNMIISGLSMSKMLFKLHKLLRGKQINNPYLKNLMLSSMKIETEHGFDYTMDGDMFFAEKDLNIEIGERLKFVHV